MGGTKKEPVIVQLFLQMFYTNLFPACTLLALTICSNSVSRLIRATISWILVYRVWTSTIPVLLTEFFTMLNCALCRKCSMTFLSTNSKMSRKKIHFTERWRVFPLPYRFCFWILMVVVRFAWKWLQQNYSAVETRKKFISNVFIFPTYWCDACSFQNLFWDRHLLESKRLSHAIKTPHININCTKFLNNWLRSLENGIYIHTLTFSTFLYMPFVIRFIRFTVFRTKTFLFRVKRSSLLLFYILPSFRHDVLSFNFPYTGLVMANYTCCEINKWRTDK